MKIFDLIKLFLEHQDDIRELIELITDLIRPGESTVLATSIPEDKFPSLRAKCRAEGVDFQDVLNCVSEGVSNCGCGEKPQSECDGAAADNVTAGEPNESGDSVNEDDGTVI